MAAFRIRPIDQLVRQYWQVQGKLSEARVEGTQVGFRTAVRCRRLLSEGEALGYNLDDEMARQLQADSDADFRI